MRFVIALALAVSTMAVPSALGTPGPPLSIAALGGAISANPAISWSTGTSPAVASHRARLGALARGIDEPRFRRAIRAYTFASRRYETVADLDEQVRKAARQPWRYATVDVGVGDVCAGTPLGVFRARLKTSLAALAKPAQAGVDGLDPPVGRQILVVSIEDLARHWRVVRADPAGAAVLRSGRHLDCGLAYDAAPARLAEIRRRTIALNEIIARACFHTDGCLYDAGARFRMPLRASHFSAFDPRYLSIAGQRALAATEWRPAFALIQAGS
jgi:hypothetical protein